VRRKDRSGLIEGRRGKVSGERVLRENKSSQDGRGDLAFTRNWGSEGALKGGLSRSSREKTKLEGVLF